MDPGDEVLFAFWQTRQPVVIVVGNVKMTVGGVLPERMPATTCRSNVRWVASVAGRRA
jgi:hypothetical protein